MASFFLVQFLILLDKLVNMLGKLILVCKQNQISWKLADWDKTRGDGLYNLALDSEILLLPLKKGYSSSTLHPEKLQSCRIVVIFAASMGDVSQAVRSVQHPNVLDPSHGWLVRFFLYRYFSDKGHSYGRRWPHVWQQRQAGLQHPAGPALFFCGAADRYSRQ